MGVELVVRDFFREPLTEQEITRLASMCSMKDLFSFRSPSFRKLGISPDTLTDERMVSLILQDARMIRRPLLRVGDRLIVGNDQAAYREAFG